MPVKAINSVQEFQAIINGDKPVVIDFWAPWCGPCRQISPVLEKLSDTVTGVDYYKVDVDEQPDISQEVGIRVMPTFIVFHKGNKIDELAGAHPAELERLVKGGADLA